MCCFVILLFNEMQMSVQCYNAIPHLREFQEPQITDRLGISPKLIHLTSCL